MNCCTECMEPGEAVVCAKLCVARLHLCNDPQLVLDFSMLEIWESLYPRLCMMFFLNESMP